MWDISDLARVPVLAGTLVDREDVGSGGLASGLAFSPDGHHLAVADEGPEVIFWDLDPASWRAALCAMVDRDFSAQERGRFFPGGQPGPTCPG